MNEEIRKCQHCGEPIQGGRSTKKYCSDTCKQAAFYNRSALQAIPISEDEQSDDNNNLPDEDTDAAHNDYESGTLPETQPFNVKLNVTKAVPEDSYKEEMPRQAYSIPVRIQPQQSRQPFNVRQQPFDVTEEQEDDMPEPVNSKRTRLPLPALKQKQVREPEEEPYQFIRSQLLDDINDFLMDNCRTSEMFQFPNRYWYGTDLEKVKWVSTRFLCYIENILCLDRRTTPSKTIKALSKAMDSMTKAWNFQYLPHNYPLKDEIITCQKAIARTANACETGNVRFYIPHDIKVKLIGRRFQLADLVPFVSYHKLDFSK